MMEAKVKTKTKKKKPYLNVMYGFITKQEISAFSLPALLHIFRETMKGEVDEISAIEEKRINCLL